MTLGTIVAKASFEASTTPLLGVTVALGVTVTLTLTVTLGMTTDVVSPSNPRAQDSSEIGSSSWAPKVSMSVVRPA